MVETYDVIVAGSGCAGAMAAIAAADAGASVLLVEKSPHIGGTTMLSSGFARVASDATGAAEYLDRTSAGRISRPLSEALAQGMTEVPGVLRDLALRAQAQVSVRFGAEQASNETEDLYDWPGRESLGWAGIEGVAGFDRYPWVHGGSKGQLLMRVLQLNIEQRPIDVWLGAPARRLVCRQSFDGTKEVTGLIVERDGREIAIEARGGVILATGGFEFNRQMLLDYMEIPVLLPMGHAGNNGDGIAMAMEAGAALWHMWHIHGSYGFKLPNLPVAVRNPLGGARNPARPLAWVLVDQRGQRFTNELPRAPQDTLSRPLSQLNEENGHHERIPAWMIFDDNARKRGPIGRPVAAQPEHVYEWSKDNSKEVSKGWIRQAPTLEALAAAIKVPVENFVRTIGAWNNAVAAGSDPLFARPPASMVSIDTPPFHAIEVWPVVSNTQGGPVHDEHQQVLDVRGRLIPGLFAVGELGSFFGHIYLLGGNISEGIVGGRIAARRAAKRAQRSTHAETRP
ncbi:MAG: hypothetical protein A3H35_20260 [Betaproteobacteria bacterium RIFCSPLOWO2_02_FULL_62_17]|nr:MAG: hypothetical protein A3H35_20260 [Betaproteobacteria bacterium RIFCSPLOWO2_02_FULL_62_17]